MEPLAQRALLILLPGKIPILPEYLIGQEGNKLIFKNYKGDIVEYPELIDA